MSTDSAQIRLVLVISLESISMEEWAINSGLLLVISPHDALRQAFKEQRGVLKK